MFIKIMRPIKLKKYHFGVLTGVALLSWVSSANAAYPPNTGGPNQYCTQPVTEMTNDYAAIHTAINAMTATGDTFINVGLAWGWRMLSPQWNGYWGSGMTGNNLPLPYSLTTKLGSSTGNQKIAILLTDGDNNITSSPDSYYGAYSFLADGNLGTTNATTVNDPMHGTLVTEMDQVCANMKADNINLFVIALDVPAGIISSATLTHLQNCAGAGVAGTVSPTTFFYDINSAGDLDGAFSQIASSIQNLHVSN